MKMIKSIKLFDFKYEWEKLKDKIIIAIAWKMPRRLVTHCYARVAAHAVQGKYSGTVVPELSMIEALKRWNEK